MKERTEHASAHRACAGARGRAHRGVHLRHAAHAHHARDAAQAPRAGAGRDLGASSATGTAARASATPAGLSRRAALCRLSRAARVVLICPTGWSAATRRDGERCARLVARSPGACRWLTPLAADPRFTPQTDGAEGDPAAGRRSGRRLVGRAPICAHVLEPAKASGARMTEIVDAHHHIWRQADMPWLRPDAAAHLRALRADPPRLSDRGISGRPRRHRRR